jgi:hypothetical protein
MAMELNIFSDRRLGSIAEWQQAIDAEGFPVQLARDVDLSTASGFLPVDLRSKRTGFECYQDEAWEMMESLGRSNFDRDWKFAFGLRWGPDFTALDSAWMAATAYAAATGGVIFDYEEAKIFTPDQARELIRRFEREQPMLDALIKEVTRKIAGKS